MSEDGEQASGGLTTRVRLDPEGDAESPSVSRKVAWSLAFVFATLSTALAVVTTFPLLLAVGPASRCSEAPMITDRLGLAVALGGTAVTAMVGARVLLRGAPAGWRWLGPFAWMLGVVAGVVVFPFAAIATGDRAPECAVVAPDAIVLGAAYLPLLSVVAVASLARTVRSGAAVLVAVLVAWTILSSWTLAGHETDPSLAAPPEGPPHATGGLADVRSVTTGKVEVVVDDSGELTVKMHDFATDALDQIRLALITDRLEPGDTCYLPDLAVGTNAITREPEQTFAVGPVADVPVPEADTGDGYDVFTTVALYGRQTDPGEHCDQRLIAYAPLTWTP
ncbi:hypothetical protein GCM10010988_05260 [Cnuibacter physcomitrellae]|uniref:Uncharacterized protein n=1 Tax=Cnuibacter physcomitrellae TaxID=1619308 RepID=A0A1X9LNB8_9MICO|nr:hypothetical protein [Cnuibacter physcomitrellae]ARJ05441.1 hypothetical protein B5808_09550 [Cnuibacter physcomitrellae]GGI35702.1 hypothetical protein GCM10010988_05260 [Cnuibacter physcomitrellae]